MADKSREIVPLVLEEEPDILDEPLVVPPVLDELLQELGPCKA